MPLTLKKLRRAECFWHVHLPLHLSVTYTFLLVTSHINCIVAPGSDKLCLFYCSYFFQFNVTLYIMIVINDFEFT